MDSSTHEAVVDSPMLETKFFTPRWRTRQVVRTRLVDRLKRCVESKLTLVSAPPGFGKTTLLAEWLAGVARDEQHIAWLSLDERDNRPATFWTYVFRALDAVLPEGGKSVTSLLQSAQPPPIETVLPMVLNEVAAASQQVVLVLDDYHVIEEASIHDGVAFLLDHMPDNMHLVISGRSDPMVPLSRLRARGQLAEIRAVDLRFSPAEAAAFLNGEMGLSLSAEHVAALESRTEGWIAALQLAALSMQGRDDVSGFITAFAGDNRYIVDYLVEEVLQRQPVIVREFLLRTSLLNRLCGPLCDAVTGQAGGKVTLETLERSNLFVVPLDDKRQWYRYHHLFADVLRSHLVEEQPEEVPMLHARASGWYADAGQADSAILHAVAADDLVRAAGLVELEAEPAMRSHQPVRLMEWIRPIPDELVRQMPVLSTYYAMALQGMGELEDSAARLDDAERALNGGAGSTGMVVVDAKGFRALPSRIALARGYLTMAAGDVTSTRKLAQRALTLLPDDERHWRGTAASLLGIAHWAAGDLEAAQRFHLEGVINFEQAGDAALALISIYNDAELLKARGRLKDAARMYERGLALAARHGDAVTGLANLHFGLSELRCEQGELETARGQLQLGAALGMSPVPPSTPYRHCLARARLQQSLGDIAGAVELLDEAEPLYVRTPVPNVRPLPAWRARLWLKQGKLSEALDWTCTQGLSAGAALDYEREYHHITLARALIARYEATRDVDSGREVGELLERLRDAAEAGGRMGAVIEIMVLQAVLHHVQHEIPSALVHLKRALELAGPEGYVGTFVDEGKPMRELLRHAVAGGIGGAYAVGLLAAAEGRSGGDTVAMTDTQGLAEPLTAREVEILRLVAVGLRNQQIADHLVISLPTVKRHIANTYGKLGAGHRTEAVARATELGLL